MVSQAYVIDFLRKLIQFAFNQQKQTLILQ